MDRFRAQKTEVAIVRAVPLAAEIEYSLTSAIALVESSVVALAKSDRNLRLASISRGPSEIEIGPDFSKRFGHEPLGATIVGGSSV